MSASGIESPVGYNRGVMPAELGSSAAPAPLRNNSPICIAK